MRQFLVPAAVTLDLLCVVVFVVLGRAEHHASHVVSGVAETAWPFAVALLAGWLLSRAWRAPTRVVPTGLVVWPVTVAGGMLLRVLTGGTTQPSFIVVTSLFLGATLLGWRAVAALLRRRAGRPATPPQRPAAP
ncbi:DUF3054 domain-containing protein [Halostreptopolyspora alba]|uniref:DUF3054 domain-containing protein n=1 Tax=Halostreptopolyspora alba TaxID=2487137 RepID=A0A3N0E3T7_9ACTN|nr:DUF3054 domain-containing protein [Nocardiopsaceae bacterium YIM 96095]